jgi:phospholipase C
MLTRRQFLHGIGAGIGAAGLSGLEPFVATAGAVALPPPELSGIDHIILVMMENRSFDHFLGWMRGADGRQAGLTFFDRANLPHATHVLAPDFQGCGFSDPDHSYDGGRVEFNNGACDGWLRAGANDEFSIGYYRRQDLSFFGQAAPDWTICDQYFSSILAETFSNRIYQHAAQTDRLDNTFEFSMLPTIWDRLAARGIEGRYYFSDVPALALWGAKYISIARPLISFLIDCWLGTLPPVSFVDPAFLGAEQGTSGDDHPYADIRNGQAFMNLIYTFVTTGPKWRRTVLVFNYDEWGGFFDHVPPPTAPIPDADRAAGNEDGRLGFRVPCMIVSPFARRVVSNTVFDHTSVLKMIEWRFGLEPLTVRDQSANNLAEALDFRRNRVPLLYPVPFGPFGGACPSATAPPAATAAGGTNEWSIVRDMARGVGWPI